jgi:hypothetical protein
MLHVSSAQRIVLSVSVRKTMSNAVLHICDTENDDGKDFCNLKY